MNHQLRRLKCSFRKPVFALSGLIGCWMPLTIQAQTSQFIFPTDFLSRFERVTPTTPTPTAPRTSGPTGSAAQNTQIQPSVKPAPLSSEGEEAIQQANNLAWTNRLPDAIVKYEALIRDPATAHATRVPLANAYRWAGRPDLAETQYLKAISGDPSNSDAATGLEQAQRELRPRTSLKLGAGGDSNDLNISTATLSHSWRDKTNTQVFRLDTDFGHYKQDPSGPNPKQAGLTFSYENVASSLQPRITVSGDGNPASGIFGELKLKLSPLPVFVDIAHENFGRTAQSARALNAKLTANRIGIEGQWGGSLGALSGRLAIQNVSDGNQIRTGNLKFTPAWRPLGLAFKPYIAVDTRDVRFNTPEYWSPADGSGSLGLGLTAEWSDKDWYLVLAGQAGTRLYGEAGTSWVGSAAAQRWIDKDTAVTVNLFGLSSIRDKTRYRSHSLSVKLDRLW